MLIVTFADETYSVFASHLLDSLHVRFDFNVQNSVVYYAVGARATLPRRDCLQVQFPLPDGAPRTNYFKPRILLDALDRFPDESCFCYLDADMIVGHRLNFDAMLGGRSFDFPLAPTHLYEVPLCEIDGTVHSPAPLCGYFNVPVSVECSERTIRGNTCRYTQNCVILYHREHREFLEEWQSWCENRYLWKSPHVYFQYQDETAFNVLLWKRRAVETLGYVHTTLTQYVAFKRGEESDDVRRLCLQDGLEWSWVDDSGRLMFYHGTKDKAEAALMVAYLRSLPQSQFQRKRHESPLRLCAGQEFA